jgi:hypothetical protein
LSGGNTFGRFVKGWRIYQTKPNNPLKSSEILAGAAGAARRASPTGAKEDGSTSWCDGGNLKSVKSNGSQVPEQNL